MKMRENYLQRALTMGGKTRRRDSFYLFFYEQKILREISKPITSIETTCDATVEKLHAKNWVQLQWKSDIIKSNFL